MLPAKKSLGQHFLVEPAVSEKILRASRFSAGQLVLEVGPGRGALTRPLIGKNIRLIAVELDHDLVERLKSEFKLELRTDTPDGFPVYQDGTMTILEADIRQVRLAGLRAWTGGSGPLRIVGNLPYNQATSILQDLLAQSAEIEDMTLMFQREVADRLIANPGSRDYGYLSVLVQTQCAVEKLFHVHPGAFHPRPKVESAVVRLTPIRPERVLPVVRNRFLKLISACFASKRKTLFNNLRPIYSNQSPDWIHEACARAGIDSRRRAETLSVEEFIALTTQLESAEPRT